MVELVPVRQLPVGRVQAEVTVQPRVELEAVALIVVVSGIGADVQGATVGHAQEFVDAARGLVGAGRRLVRLEAALVVAVEDEQDRARSHQRRQDVVVADRAQVGRQLLGVADVAQIAPVGRRHVPGDRHAHRDALVERGQHDRLPAAAGQPGHGHARGVGQLVIDEEVQGALHGEVEHPGAGLAQQVQELLVVVRCQVGHLAAAEQLQAQRRNPAPGQVAAARLLVLDGDAARLVAVHVQHGRGRALAARRRGRLVEQRRHPDAGIPLEAQLADAVLGGRIERVAPDHARRLLQQVRRMAVQVELQVAGAQPGGARLPLGRSVRQLDPRTVAGDVFVHQAVAELGPGCSGDHRSERRFIHGASIMEVQL